MAEEKRNVMTESGLAELQKKLDYLIGTRRNEVAHQIEVARGFGDLSENAEYDEAKKEQGRLEAEITRLQGLIDTAVVVPDDEISTEKVSVGTTVTIRNTATGDEASYAIVGAEETDPLNGKISNESPIGAGLIGKTKGEVVTIEIPSGSVSFEIVDIRR